MYTPPPVGLDAHRRAVKRREGEAPKLLRERAPQIAQDPLTDLELRDEEPLGATPLNPDQIKNEPEEAA
jgi:hypothetical protein